MASRHLLNQSPEDRRCVSLTGRNSLVDISPDAFVELEAPREPVKRPITLPFMEGRARRPCAAGRGVVSHSCAEDFAPPPFA